MSYSYNTNYKPKVGKGKPCKLPLDCSYMLPYIAMNWLYRYGITLDLVNKYQLQWSETYDGGRLIIPNYSDDGKLLGFQGRDVREYYEDKYSSRGSKSFLRSKNQELNIINHGCVIVEDVMSCIKVGEVTACVALQGNTISDEKILELALQYEWFLLWLDKDLGGDLGTINILPRLRRYRYAASITTEYDPKCYTFDEIRDILNAFQRSS